MSSRYSIFFCRKKPSEEFRQADFSSDDPEFEDKELKAFSEDNGEVIYLAEQENVGFIHYEHWQNGMLVRRLKYNNDYSWLSSDGEPEKWEIDLLFSSQNLSTTLGFYEPERHEEIRNVWERKNIQSGDAFPILGAIDLVHIIKQFWKIST